MELLNVARVLLRRRILAAVGLLAAVALGGALSGVLPPGSAGGAQPAGGEALAQVLIDTSLPLATTTTSRGDDTIVQRSVLLAALMSSDAMTATVAHRAGLQPDQVAVVGPVFYPVSVNTLLPDGELPQDAALAAQRAVTEPYVVQLTTDATEPIISIDTAAPNVRQAESLAEATIAALRSAASAPSGAQSTLVEPLGPVRGAVSSVSGSRHLLGLAAAVVVFALWCTGIVMASGLVRLWRRLGLGVPKAQVVR